MENKPIIALMYDFDRTLSPKNMQEYAFIPGLGMDPASFWAKCDQAAKKYAMDDILAYMHVMLEESQGVQLVTKSTLRAIGAQVELFPGVDTWFDRINQRAEACGLKAEHYLISSGLREIIEGTSIADRFTGIFASSFCCNDRGVPFWPAEAVNYTSKTQFLFRINKGVTDPSDRRLNEYMPAEERRVPFSNMVYIGDGMTDVPCMKLTRVNGGHSVAVYEGEKKLVEKLLADGRIDFGVPADYSPQSPLENAIFRIIDLVAAKEKLKALEGCV
ncbi:MAG: haloacid dehalogenase-like hydrolase [Ruminococcaceae bacterium]|nr:haloacid dehalogenase-like hydrolase [Oscillospiraceae bacterium]